MQNVLVTGGAGFIGSNFIHYLMRQAPNVRVVNLDVLTYAANADNLKELEQTGRYTFVQGNICERSLVDRLLREAQVDTVVHFAAETHVDRSIYDPGLFVQTNIIGTFTLLEAARQFWLVEKKLDESQVHFHHVSTDEVFGTLKPEDPAFTETTPFAPNSPYAASKAASDNLVRVYYHTYHLPVTITNCSNNYGPYQFPEKLIPLMILNALNGKPLPIYGDGMQVRDWLFVEDHCEAILEVIRRGRRGETYNVGGDNQPPNIEIVHEICAILDELKPDSGFAPHSQLITHVADRPGHDRRYAMDITKINRELGWKPSENLHTGLLKTVRWYLQNPAWVKQVTRNPEYQAWLHKNYAKRENR